MKTNKNYYRNLLMFALFLGVAVLPGVAATLVVCPGCPDPGKYPDLNLAVGAASSGDVIVIEPGVYPGGILLNKDLTLVAAGLGVIVDGGGVGSVFEVATGSTVYIGALTAQNGAIDGGIVNYGDLELHGTLVANNSGTYGGIGNMGGDLYLENCVVRDNNGTISYGFGGGISNLNGTAYLYFCTIRDNHGYLGGGLHNSMGTTTLERTLLKNNRATVQGGGYSNHNLGGTVIRLSHTLTGNTSDLTACNTYYDVNRSPSCK